MANDLMKNEQISQASGGWYPRLRAIQKKTPIGYREEETIQQTNDPNILEGAFFTADQVNAFITALTSNNVRNNEFLSYADWNLYTPAKVNRGSVPSAANTYDKINNMLTSLEAINAKYVDEDCTTAVQSTETPCYDYTTETHYEECEDCEPNCTDYTNNSKDEQDATYNNDEGHTVFTVHEEDVDDGECVEYENVTCIRTLIPCEDYGDVHIPCEDCQDECTVICSDFGGHYSQQCEHENKCTYCDEYYCSDFDYGPNHDVCSNNTKEDTVAGCPDYEYHSDDTDFCRGCAVEEPEYENNGTVYVIHTQLNTCEYTEDTTNSNYLNYQTHGNDSNYTTDEQAPECGVYYYEKDEDCTDCTDKKTCTENTVETDCSEYVEYDVKP